MQQTITIKVLPAEALQSQLMHTILAKACGVPANRVQGWHILRQSLDARSRTPWLQLTVQVSIDEALQPRLIRQPLMNAVSQAPRQALIVGAGPAGLFAALQCIELGIKPIILERGKDVRTRRRDLAAMNKLGEVNPESNYCFGEGGAGTYSDGKLYTRSTKRGDVQQILHWLYYYGAPEAILYESHPHIGTNKLPGIITSMRQQIIEAGGEVHFNTRVVQIMIQNGKAKGVITADGQQISAHAVVLATGHSARDVFEMLLQQNIAIEPKPFALGVRIEHPQHLIDASQYHCLVRPAALPPASYSLVQQVNGRGVFSFCMCPGGIIAPAATNPGELVVNGWSPSKRNNPFANSGMVTEIRLTDLQAMAKKPPRGFANGSQLEGPLGFMYFQQWVEQQAWQAGGGKLVAPAQRMVDFVQNKPSASLPQCSYLPGIKSALLTEVLPPFVAQSLQQGFKAFGQKMKGYLTNEAVLVATESRTSSPVRIPRHPQTLQHIHIAQLYPCAEGAGYAGGIVSAAMDGIKVAKAIAVSMGISIPAPITSAAN